MHSRENLYKNYIARLNDDPSEQNAYEDNRLPAQVDLCRLIHSFPFRKLQGKKQLFGINIGDFHRTRLTHSYEVASIARGILDKIISDEPKNTEGDFNTDETTEIYDLFGQDSKLHKFKEATFDHKKLMNVYDHIRAAALAHDIGHPPYGHGGESALNYMMQNDEDCGFEGNAQNLRILSPLNPLENMFNLTRRTLLAVAARQGRLKAESRSPR